jgi:hypothetical protein
LNMTKRRVESSTERPDYCFTKELGGEVPPSFSSLEQLYELATELFRLRPWEILDETNLILVGAGAGGQMCHCSVMGAAGEVYSMHAYIGDEGLRLFHEIRAHEITEPGEFFARQNSVSVEFVPRSELERQDREVLSWLGHPKGKGVACPIFRAIRPGFYPWFVSAEEARILVECVRAVIAVCSAILSDGAISFWKSADTYPLVSKVGDEAEGAPPRYKIDLVKSVRPVQAVLPPVNLSEERLATVRNKDYPIRGVTELDYLMSGAIVGKPHERKTFACIALAVDAASGMLYAPETTDLTVPAAEALANVFLKSMQSARCVPKEVRVRTGALKDSLNPLMGSLGVAVKASRKLPAADEARASMLRFLGAGF